MQYAKPVTLNVEECDRLSFLPYLFGNDFLYAEAYVYALAQKMMPEYQGGFWHFIRLPDGGGYPKGSQSTELFTTIILTTKREGQKNEWIQKQFTERSGLALAACRKPGRYSGGQWTLDGSGRSMATGCRGKV